VHCLVIRGRRRTFVRPTHPGTLLNNRSVSEAELRHGDLLQIGPVVLEYLDAVHAPNDSPFSIPVRDSSAMVDPAETGHSPTHSFAREDELQRPEAALARRKEELDCLAEALRRCEAELALRESRVADEENRLNRREQECLQSERDKRRVEQELTDHLKRVEEREADIAAQELELRQWEARIVEREAQLQRDQEELRRRVSEIAARERELSAWEEALRRKEQTIAVPPASPTYAHESATVSTDVDGKRDDRDPFAATESARVAEVQDRDGFAEPFELQQAAPEAVSHGHSGWESGENSLISAKWLRREEQIEEPGRDAPGPMTTSSESIRESTGDSGTSPDARQADDSASDDVDSYMQSLLSRLRGRDETMNASRISPEASAKHTESKGFRSVEEAKSQVPGKTKVRPDGQTPARERPQAAEKSVDFAAMRELAVLASQGAIDRYAKAKLRAAMRGKLAVMATALGCGLLLTALGWAGRLPGFGVYGIVAAAVALLVYALQYAILSGRLVVNPRGQLQLAERRISREMFKLQTGEKSSLGFDLKTAPTPETSVQERSAVSGE